MTAILLIVPLIAAAPVPKDFKKATERLDALWELVGVDVHGRPSPFQKSSWRIEGDSLTVENPNGGIGSALPIKTDPTASPKEFAFAQSDNRMGIYEIKGDRLTICIGQVNARPKDTTGGRNTVVYSFTRVK